MKYLIFIIFIQVASANETSWKISNKTDSERIITCKGITPGLPFAIELSPKEIRSNHGLKYTWEGYYNDGMGLNFARWKCQSGYNRIEFETDWGEEISLVLLANEILLVRLSSQVRE